MTRWPCEYEGLTRRVRADGREEWVEPPPPDCHGPMRATRRRCADCGYACRHWSCACGTEVRDGRHVCDGQRPVDPGRR